MKSSSAQRHRPSRSIKALVAAAIFLAGIALGRALRPHDQAAPNVLETAKTYPYLSKRIFVDSPNDVIINFINLRQYLREYVGQAEKGAPSMGVYFEYLPSGISIGINDTMPYLSASLLKVPLSMGIYKQIQEDRTRFDMPLLLKSEHLDRQAGTLWQRGAGVAITVEEAVSAAIIRSDNTAKNLLVSQLPLEEMNRVYEYLDIPTTSRDFSALISPKNYSSIFKSLYLSSFLNKDLSNRLLEHLTHAEFAEGIRAGVPKDIPMAHKYGIDRKQGAAIIDSFTSCGIVYLPSRPYLLCVMTAGMPLEEANERVAHVSRAVYEFTVSVRSD